MDARNTAHRKSQSCSSAISSALLFAIAAGFLVLTSVAVEPLLILPITAFLLMVGLTRHIGRDLYLELAGSTKTSR